MTETSTDDGRLAIDDPEIEAAQVAATDDYVTRWNAAQVIYNESRNKYADREADSPQPK